MAAIGDTASAPGRIRRLATLWWRSPQSLRIGSLILLIIPKTRHNEKILAFSLVLVVVSLWIDKGLAMVVTGFIPNPLGQVIAYWPTVAEVLISVGVYALGALVLTVLYRIAISIRGQLKG